MSEVLSPIILVGPTTVGKSDLACELADKTGGHLVNADRFYLYAGKTFMLGLGLKAGELEDDRPRSLYGHLDPMDAPLSPDEFLAVATGVIEGIHNNGGVAIVEGCNRSYNAALITYFGLRHAIGITWADKQGLAKKVDERISSLVNSGLYEETKEALNAGYGTAYPMRRGVFYRPAVDVLRGKLPASEGLTMMRQYTLDTAEVQDEYYSQVVDRRIAYERARTIETGKAILRHFERTALAGQRQ